MGIILMVDGGLASQLNKYFIGQFLEKKLKTDVKYDLSWFDSYGKSADGKDTRNFDLLKIFPNIKFPIASKEVVQFYKNNYYYVNQFPFVYNEEILQKTPPLYVDGYFSHWKYLIDGDYSDLDFNITPDEVNQKNLNSIKDSDCSVAVHIRRGDYVGGVHDVLGADYFLNTIKYMHKQLEKNNPKFFIFSTDMEWVKENILSHLPKNICYQSFSNNTNSDGIYDFYLMSNCKHQICSNSTFSYYAAILNKSPEKQTIIPETWMNVPAFSPYCNSDKAFRYPGWTVMSNDGRILTETQDKENLPKAITPEPKVSDSPKISILCPSFNHERYVKCFIESVLNQTEQDFELIIVDDCSKDRTVEEIENFSDPRIKLIKHEYNKGINVSLNDAFRASKGQYCVFIASDDILEPNHLEESTGFLDKNPNVGVFYSSLNIMNENNVRIADYNSIYLRNNSDRFDLLKKMFFIGNMMLSPGMVIRREAMEKIIPLSASMLQYQDYQMNVKLLLNNEIYQTPKRLVNYRQISGNKNTSARTDVVQKREELEEYKLMDTFLEIKDLNLLRNIFKEEITQVGEPTSDTIPYFLGIMAFSSEKEIRKNWAYNTIMNFIEKEENLELLNKTYKVDFKAFIDLVNVLDVNNSFSTHQHLIKLVHEYAEKAQNNNQFLLK